MERLIRRGGPHKRSPRASRVLAIGLAFLFSCNDLAAATETGMVAAPAATVDVRNQSASPEVRRVASWVTNSNDNRDMPYAIVDKANARVFVFDAHRQLLGTDAALLGMAKGDRSVAGIGDRKMSSIRPEERTTPAGRFQASLDHDIHGQEILVIDYADSISLHPIIKGTPAEHRAERMVSPDSRVHRISYGCINVPLKFYNTVVSPTFAHTYGVVYILPEMSPASEFFGFRDGDANPQERDSPTLGKDATHTRVATKDGGYQHSPR